MTNHCHHKCQSDKLLRTEITLLILPTFCNIRMARRTAIILQLSLVALLCYMCSCIISISEYIATYVNMHKVFFRLATTCMELWMRLKFFFVTYVNPGFSHNTL